MQPVALYECPEGLVDGGVVVVRGGGRRLRVVDGVEQFLHRDFDEFNAQAFLDYRWFCLAGYEPVGGFSDDAEATAAKLLTGIGNTLQQRDALGNVWGAAVNNLTLHLVLAQEGEYLHGRSQRIAFA